MFRCRSQKKLPKNTIKNYPTSPPMISSFVRHWTVYTSLFVYAQFEFILHHSQFNCRMFDLVPIFDKRQITRRTCSKPISWLRHFHPRNTSIPTRLQRYRSRHPEGNKLFLLNASMLPTSILSLPSVMAV